jgi:hypothetical protein
MAFLELLMENVILWSKMYSNMQVLWSDSGCIEYEG